MRCKKGHDLGKMMWDVVAGRELTPGGLQSVPIPAAAREVALVCARRTAECCGLNTAGTEGKTKELFLLPLWPGSR